MSDWHNNCAHGCRDGSHKPEDAREGHGDTTGARVTMGYTCVCGVFRHELTEWHDHLVGNEADQERQQRQDGYEKIMDEIMTRYGDTLRRLGDS